MFADVVVQDQHLVTTDESELMYASAWVCGGLGGLPTVKEGGGVTAYGEHGAIVLHGHHHPGVAHDCGDEISVGAMDVHKAIEDKLVVDVPGVDRVEDLVKDPAQYEGRKEYLFCGLCHLLLLARVWAVEVGLEG